MREHVLDHADHPAFIRQHHLPATQIMYTRDLFALKDTDHIDHQYEYNLSNVCRFRLGATNRSTDRPTRRPTDPSTDRPIDRPTHRPTDPSTDRPTDRPPSSDRRPNKRPFHKNEKRPRGRINYASHITHTRAGYYTIQYLENCLQRRRAELVHIQRRGKGYLERKKEKGREE